MPDATARLDNAVEARRQVEKTRLASEEEYHALADAMLQIVWTARPAPSQFDPRVVEAFLQGHPQGAPAAEVPATWDRRSAISPADHPGARRF